MHQSTIELTDTEIACGVTLQDVDETLRQSLVRENATKIVLPQHCPPALCGAVARIALGQPCELLGTNELGQPVYGRLVDEDPVPYADTYAVFDDEGDDHTWLDEDMTIRRPGQMPYHSGL